MKTKQVTVASSSATTKKKTNPIIAEMKRNWQLYVMISIPVIYILVFKYYPMLGAQIAFKNYTPKNGIWGSDWVGLKHFIRFFNQPRCWEYIVNTVSISCYSLVLNLPFPIILALCLDYCRSKAFGKTVQMVVYLPHFLSTVIVISTMNMILDNRVGVVNNIIQALSGTKIDFLGNPSYFRSLYVWSGVWQGTGWGSILYIAALSGVDPQIHEAAIIDGANKFRRIWHIDLTSIRPTIVIMTIMKLGTIVTVGFDKTFLMQNDVNLRVSEVLSTYEYKSGLGGTRPDYSYATAIGLMLSVVNFSLIVASNKISNKLSGSGLW
ncbi:MAG: sugar ABC transporter permease [Ruminococcaceae bacterium]|nr:sugar ABC transporter permease [Oscillospiraceae bacterium]